MRLHCQELLLPPGAGQGSYKVRAVALAAYNLAALHYKASPVLNRQQCTDAGHSRMTLSETMLSCPALSRYGHWVVKYLAKLEPEQVLKALRQLNCTHGNDFFGGPLTADDEGFIAATLRHKPEQRLKSGELLQLPLLQEAKQLYRTLHGPDVLAHQAELSKHADDVQRWQSVWDENHTGESGQREAGGARLRWGALGWGRQAGQLLRRLLPI